MSQQLVPNADRLSLAQLDDQLTQIFVFSVALNSVNALEPSERGILFLITLALLSAVLAQIETHFFAFVESQGTSAKEHWKILEKLLGHLKRIILSLFSTAAGRYVSTVMGGSIVEQPVYSLAITSIIVAVLYLVKDSLTKNTAKNGQGS